MTYRNDLDALAARHDALAAEVAIKTKELDTAKRLLDDAEQRAKLPVLPNIRVATPCTADWTKMTGDDRMRACADCNKNVYNLSDMTRDEAEALIVQKEGRLCVRYFQRKDGTILLKDCAIGVAQKRKRRLVAAGAAALLTGGGFVAHRLMREAPTPEMVTGEFAVAEDVSVPVHVAELTPPPPPPPPPDVTVVMGDVVVEQDEPHEIKGRLQVESIDAVMGDLE